MKLQSPSKYRFGRLAATVDRAIRPEADSVETIIEELEQSGSSERQGRLIYYYDPALWRGKSRRGISDAAQAGGRSAHSKALGYFASWRQEHSDRRLLYDCNALGLPAAPTWPLSLTGCRQSASKASRSMSHIAILPPRGEASSWRTIRPRAEHAQHGERCISIRPRGVAGRRL